MVDFCEGGEKYVGDTRQVYLLTSVPVVYSRKTKNMPCSVLVAKPSWVLADISYYY